MKKEKLRIPSMFFYMVLLVTLSALNALAQYEPGVKARLAGSAETTLRGVIRVRKDFGVIPMGPGHSQAAPLPCGQFYVAVLDPNNKYRLVATTNPPLNYAEDGEYYVCKYSLTVPANTRLYAIAGMGGTLLLPKEDRTPMYITDAWIGGARSKPPAGYERGFVGKYVTIGNRAVYLKFDLIYAQVDPK
ncbi:MAG TPA: hypothetical protein VF556_11175 [Pyrinomonadaceae bacterium]|jgi:hypothetical protein